MITIAAVAFGFGFAISQTIALSPTFAGGAPGLHGTVASAGVNFFVGTVAAGVGTLTGAFVGGFGFQALGVGSFEEGFGFGAFFGGLGSFTASIQAIYYPSDAQKAARIDNWLEQIRQRNIRWDFDYLPTYPGAS